MILPLGCLQSHPSMHIVSVFSRETAPTWASPLSCFHLVFFHPVGWISKSYFIGVSPCLQVLPKVWSHTCLQANTLLLMQLCPLRHAASPQSTMPWVHFIATLPQPTCKIWVHTHLMCSTHTCIFCWPTPMFPLTSVDMPYVVELLSWVPTNASTTSYVEAHNASLPLIVSWVGMPT